MTLVQALKYLEEKGFIDKAIQPGMLVEVCGECYRVVDNGLGMRLECWTSTLLWHIPKPYLMEFNCYSDPSTKAILFAIANSILDATPSDILYTAKSLADKKNLEEINRGRQAKYCDGYGLTQMIIKFAEES